MFNLSVQPIGNIIIVSYIAAHLYTTKTNSMTITEGEEFIEDFFKTQNIKYRKQQTIDGLENDSKSHRVADFFLPKFNVYVEYFGQWNVESHKERYKEKKQVYIKNQIPCVILYPENLGVIEYVFAKRMFYVMKRYRMEKELSKYKWKMMLENKGFRLLLIIGALLVIGFNLNDNTWILVGLLFAMYHIYFFAKEYRRLFHKEKAFINYFDR